jgi:O-acetyl-ADP-ribose deacetylase (regulator of RNase III)
VIEYKHGDLLAEPAEALVNAVNCVGAIGRGIALQFKRRFPDNFAAYAAACRRGAVGPGRMLVVETGQATPRWIVNFPTKRHWRDPARLEDIETGLGGLADEIRARRMRSIALPALGCGLGGLNWGEIRLRIEHSLSELDAVRVIVFEPLTASEAAARKKDRLRP